MYRRRIKVGYKLVISMLVIVNVCILGSSVHASVDYLAGKTVRIIGPHSSAWNSTLEKVYNELEKEYGFKIELDLVPWSSYIEKAMMAGKGSKGSYDVINANGEWVLGAYVSSGDVLPLDSFVKKDNYDLDRFLPLLLSLTYWPKDQLYKFAPIFSDWENGRLMGLPSFTDSVVLSYRKDWLSEAGIQNAPKTWQEFLDVVVKLTQDTNGDGKIDRWGWSIPGLVRGGQLYDEWAPIVNSWGVDILDEKGMPAFNTRKAEEATQFLVDLHLKHKVVPPGILSYSQGQNYDLFKTGKIGMVKAWYHNTASFEDPSKSVAAGKTGYAQMPVKERIAARAMTWVYVIPKNAEDPQLSWEFIKLATTFEAQKKLMPGGMPSTRQDLYAYVQKNLAGTPLATALDTVFRGDVMVQPVTPNILELVDEAISPPIQSALAGKMSVREALNTAENDARKLMEELLEAQ